MTEKQYARLKACKDYIKDNDVIKRQHCRMFSLIMTAKYNVTDSINVNLLEQYPYSI